MDVSGSTTQEIKSSNYREILIASIDLSHSFEMTLLNKKQLKKLFSSASSALSAVNQKFCGKLINQE